MKNTEANVPPGTVMGQPVAGTAAKSGLSAGKVAAYGTGAYLLLTPQGGQLAGNLAGQASQNIGNVGGNIINGLQPLFLPLSISSFGLVCMAMIFMVMMNFMN